MPREARRPKFLWHGNSPEPHTAWAMCDQVYPSTVWYGFEVTELPDPFSPGDYARKLTRTVLHFNGVGSIDLGWIVTGEPAPDFPFAGIALDQVRLGELAANWPVAANVRSADGRGSLWESWRGAHLLLQCTVVGLAYMLAEFRSWPEWSHWLRVHAERWRFTTDGVPIFMLPGQVPMTHALCAR